MRLSGQPAFASVADMRANRADYGAVDELGELSAAERLTLLEGGAGEGGAERLRAPTLRTSVTAAAMARREQAPSEHSELAQLVILLAACALAATTAAVSCSLVPLFESLRAAVGFSSFQVTCLSVAPLILSSIAALVVNNFVHCSALWDVLAWAAMSLALGSWVSACAVYGSPLEYMMCGQLFVAVSISMLAAVPAKISSFWLPKDKQGVASTLWVTAILLGMGLPFLIVPQLVGGDGEGRHLGAFLIWRAVCTTGVVAGVIGLRAGMVPNEGPERDEARLYKYGANQELDRSVHDLFKNGRLLAVVVSLALALGAAFSFYIAMPYVLSLAPHNYSPLEAGHILWTLTPMGILGVLVVRSPWFFNVHGVRRFKPALLVSVAGIGVWISIVLMVLERTNQVGLAVISGCVYVFAAALAYLSMHVTAELAFPLPDHVTAPVVAAVMTLIIGLCPLITITLTHPFVPEYATENESPTGFILSYGAIFWLVLLAMGFAGLMLAFSDDERLATIDSHPKLVVHVTDRVAEDLAQARAFSELVIPMPERLMREEGLSSQAMYPQPASRWPGP